MLQKSIILTMGSRVVKLIMSRSSLKSQMSAAEIFQIDFLTPQNKELEAAAMAELLTGNIYIFSFTLDNISWKQKSFSVKIRIFIFKI